MQFVEYIRLRCLFGEGNRPVLFKIILLFNLFVNLKKFLVKKIQVRESRLKFIQDFTIFLGEKEIKN